MTLLHVLLGLGMVALLGAAALLWSVVALVWFAGVGDERAGRPLAGRVAATGGFVNAGRTRPGGGPGAGQP